MSIKLMSKVWEVDAQPTRKLVMLALADNANDAGVCWPSIDTIAQKCSLSRRAIIDNIHELEKSGHLSYERRAGKLSTYTIHPCKDCTSETSAQVQIDASEPVQIDAMTRANRRIPPTPPYIDNHQENHQEKENHQRVRDQEAISDVIVVENEKPARKKRIPIPEDFDIDHALRAWTNSKGMGNNEIEDELLKFKNYHENADPRNALALDWRKKWQNWVLNSIKWKNGKTNGTWKNAKSTGPCFDENGNRIPEPGSGAAMWARILHEANQEHMGKHADEPVRTGGRRGGVVEGTCVAQ